MEQKKVNVQMLEPQPNNGIRTIDTTSAKLLPNPLLAAVYVAIWEADGEEPYVLNSNDCKPKERCSDSDWWFHINTKMFRRYWSFHDEVNGNQYVHDEVEGVKLNGS